MLLTGGLAYSTSLVTGSGRLKHLMKGLSVMLAHTGTFDVENFGDLLFPALLRHHLPKTDVVFVSPAGGAPQWQDTVKCFSLEALFQQPLNALVVGGGNIIHAMPSSLASYRMSGADLTGYADLWLTACLALDHKVPVLWNAPGVPGYFEPSLIPMVREVLIRSDYISVRDEESRTYLAEIEPECEILVVPDSAWDVPILWTMAELARKRGELLVEWQASEVDRYFTVHVNERYFDELGLSLIAREIDQIATRLNARPVLIAIGPCHGDSATAHKVGNSLKSKFLILDAPRSLLEIVSMISGSVAYVGSSMHGYITAAAFGVPAIVVAKGKSKFKGVVRQANAPETLVTSWAGVSELISSLDKVDLTNKFRSAHKAAVGELELHWRRITKHVSPYSGLIDEVKALKLRNRVLEANLRYFQERTIETAEILKRSKPIRREYHTHKGTELAPSEAQKTTTFQASRLRKRVVELIRGKSNSIERNQN